eukprot:CAMPEP_0168317090 /NCGR_PEP_ID=MMETSP0210-20121227/22507_1 /TAXON_ID=40633 /ORGANISM="Condylostoma magnum, Strain COL2" /LENGTH=63 /DNA_ID=CAMNT_0008311127 /DNA_START=955 /DNA_END=1146 /DNA_ORIENTATION=-
MNRGARIMPTYLNASGNARQPAPTAVEIIVKIEPRIDPGSNFPKVRFDQDLVKVYKGISSFKC